jgi:molybdenum cofactor cytidylyltransferase
MTAASGAAGAVAPPAAVLLAAGAGARFGGSKLLAPLPAASHGVAAGTPIGVAACLHLVAALPRVIAVVRPGDRALAARLRDTGADVVVCDRAQEGMGVTLAAGVEASHDAGGWVVALADMPWVAPASIAAVAGALREGASIVAPVHGGRRGHPVGFAARHYASLAALQGDEGARSVVARHIGLLREIALDDAGVLRDVDRPEDLQPPSQAGRTGP